MSESYYIQELRPFGIDKPRAFRALCRAICCPTIVLGNTAFVDPAVFQVCIKNVCLPGNLDFHGPNSFQKDSGRRYFRNRVPPEEIQRNWSVAVRAILDGRRMVGLHSPPAERAAIRSAAAELTRFVLTMIPSAEQPDGKAHKKPRTDDCEPANQGSQGCGTEGCGWSESPEAGEEEGSDWGCGPHQQGTFGGDEGAGQQVDCEEDPAGG